MHLGPLGTAPETNAMIILYFNAQNLTKVYPNSTLLVKLDKFFTESPFLPLHDDDDVNHGHHDNDSDQVASLQTPHYSHDQILHDS